MRLAALVLGLVTATAGCGARGAHGPAWPKPTEPEVDGGESIAPRSSTAVAAIEGDVEDRVSQAEASEVAAEPAAAAGTSDAVAPEAEPVSAAADDDEELEESDAEVEIIEIDELED